MEKQDKKEFVIDAKQELWQEVQMQSRLIESGGEFVLPDYMPMMQKVLRLEARALPPDRYVSANNVQMSGEVLHTLIYIGEDGETGATVLPAKYEFQIPTEGYTSPDIRATVEVDGLTYRITAPRKLNIRTRLNAKCYCIEKEEIMPEVKPSDAQINKLYQDIESIRTRHLNSTDAELTDRIGIGSAKDTKLLWCGASSAVTDARAVEGGVNVRGDVVAKLLCESDGAIKMYTKKIPFDEFLEGDVNRGDYVSAIADVVATEAVKEDGGEAEVTVGIFIDANVDSPLRLAVLKDAFSSDYDTQTEYKKIKARNIVKEESIGTSVGASIAKSTAGIPENASIIDTSGRAVVEEITANGGKINISGRCDLSSLMLSGEEYTSAEYSVPLSISVDCNTDREMNVAAHVALINPRVRIEGDNLVCDMDLSLSYRACATKEEDMLLVVECQTSKKLPKSEYPLCLIYSNGESLWDLAKKYRTSPEKLAAVNSLKIEKSDYCTPSALAEHNLLMLELE